MLVSFQYFACIAISWSNTHIRLKNWLKVSASVVASFGNPVHYAPILYKCAWNTYMNSICSSPSSPLDIGLSLPLSVCLSVSCFLACIRKLSCMPVFSVLRLRPVCQNKTTYNCTLHNAHACMHMYYKYNTSPATINIRHEYLLDTL